MPQNSGNWPKIAPRNKLFIFSFCRALLIEKDGKEPTTRVIREFDFIDFTKQEALDDYWAGYCCFVRNSFFYDSREIQKYRCVVCHPAALFWGADVGGAKEGGCFGLW
jgi:hypothetical protein